MEKCHLTYSYIFTPWVPELLSSHGFDLTREPDSNGTVAHDMWLGTSNGPFCARLIEVIDETSLTSKTFPSELSLRPGFEFKMPESPQGLTPKFQLQGFLFQDKAPLPQDISNLQLPAPVHHEPPESQLARMLSYRKVSPYWALVVKPTTERQELVSSEKAIRLSWRNQDALWLQLETTCWDILIII